MEYSYTIAKYETNYNPVKFCSLAVDPKEIRHYMRYLHVIDNALYGINGHRVHSYSPIDLDTGVYRIAKDRDTYILSKVDPSVSELGLKSSLLDALQKLMPATSDETDTELWQSAHSSKKGAYLSILLWQLAAKYPEGTGIDYNLLKDALTQCDRIRKSNDSWWLTSHCMKYRATVGGLRV